MPKGSSKLRRWSNDHFSVVLPFLSYDKVVDRSQYRPDYEGVRDFMKSAISKGGSGSSGVYDYKDGKVNSENSPTDIEIALRTGNLDKAEVDTLIRHEEEVVKGKVEKAREAADVDAQNELNKKRQAAVDKALGLDSSSDGAVES